jgi:nucleoid-associated protein YgaU
MNPQERENRGDQRDERNRADQREEKNRGDQREEKNREEKRKEKSDKPSRLGREAKIGVTVILLLLGTFAAVVAVRMTKGDLDEKQLASADHEGGKHKGPAAKDNDLFKGMGADSFSRRPTMVPPARAPSTSLPGNVDSKLDKWKLPSDRGEPKRAESRYGAPISPPSVPPSFATDPPKPSSGSRYGRTANDSLPGLEPEKPGRFSRKVSDLPPPPPEPKKHPLRTDPIGTVATRDSFERSDLSGFADASAGSRAGRREKSRYDDSAAALMAPEPPREKPSYGRDRNDSFAGSSRSKYDDGFAPASAPPVYEREKPRRHDSSSYGNQPLRHDGKYEVQPGDSYWTISERVYGSGGYYQALAEQNRGKVGNVNRLTPGDVISAPSVVQLEKIYPELCPKASRRETQESRTMAVSTRGSYRGGRTYTVTEGDTLFNIARYELGKAGRWVELYDLNRDLLGKDFNYLTPGMKLVLPDDKTEVLTRKSGDLVR